MLKGDKIYLRAMEPSDIDLLFEWENNTENWLNSGTHKPFSRHAIENHVLNARDVYTEKQLRLMIATRSEGRTVGTIDLFDCDFANARAGVGILIEFPADRGNGYGREALSLLCAYCGEVLLLNQLHAEVLETNTASIQLFESAGFSRTGYRPEWVKTKSGYSGTVLFQYKLKTDGR